MRSPWPARIALSKLRPFDAAAIARTAFVLATAAAFLYGDYALFRRLFRAVAQVEAQTPWFAVALLRNLLSLVFLTATVILFSSSMTASIGAFFTDLDLDVYHSAPRGRLRIAVARWLKTLLQSASIVFLFLLPMLLAYEHQFPQPLGFHAVAVANLALLLTVPVSLASILIILLVRWFPVRRVHQIVATIALLVLTTIVIAFRVSRPERFFAPISTGDAARALQAIELPTLPWNPARALAQLIAGTERIWLAPQIALPALLLFALFLLTAHRWYFVAFVRARESMAPSAFGAGAATQLFDRLLRNADPSMRALLGKEVRTLGRDVAQWSQLLLMCALVFIYLFNIRMLPLGGDARATLVAYANLGMSGFVISAICLRFAYPSVSTEGRAFWIVQTAPVSYRQFLLVKVVVYSIPLTLLSLLLTVLANLLLDANATVWFFTTVGALLLGVTLVSLGVGMGGIRPQFRIENPLQVGLSLGGFAYMAISMAYVVAVMLLMARPLTRYLFERVLGGRETVAVVSIALPISAALLLSALLSVIPLLFAERRLRSIGTGA